MKNLNWDEIQIYYNSGFTVEQTALNFHINPNTIYKRCKLGKFNTRSKSEAQKLDQLKNPRILSKETKDKISASRIEYLNKNPEMVPYKLNHYSKGLSYPERYWKEILISNNIIFTDQFQIGLYSLDFALVDKMIDLEIDGEQHYLDQRIVASDQRRTKFLEDLGWTVIRIRWSEYKKLKDKQKFIDLILTTLNGSLVQ